MASNPLKPEHRRQLSGGSSGAMTGTDFDRRYGRERWNIRLSLGQVVVLWSVLAGMMVMVFLFGVWAGREQGIKLALEEHGGQGARLPAPLPQAMAGSPGEASRTTREVVDEAVEESALALSDEAIPPPVATDEMEIDFRPDAGLADSDEAAPENGGAAALAALEGADEAPLKPGKKFGLDLPADTAAGAKAATPPKGPATVISSRDIAPGWYVQVAAARALPDAQAMAGKLSGLPVESRIEEAKVGGATYYRLLAGPATDKDGALKTAQVIKRAKVAQGEPFVKHIR